MIILIVIVLIPICIIGYSFLNDNSADKKCAEANHELQHILYEFNSLENKINDIKNKTYCKLTI